MTNKEAIEVLQKKIETSKEMLTKKYFADITDTIEDTIEACEIAISAIESLPSAQPERKKGEWIPHHDKVMLFDGMSMGGMACSVCRWKTHNKMHLIFGCPYKYCPNCGAQMEENEHHTMEEFMQGQDMGNPEDGSL